MTRTRTPPSLVPGRSCPADYYYDAVVFDRAPDLVADVLYVVGGLYGNRVALDVIDKLRAGESGAVTVVFNGDFHWFDAEAVWFSEIDTRVAGHPALRGNVEAEIARSAEIGAGCGCAYPEAVDDHTVQRSNEILARLRRTALAFPAVVARLQRLPMHLVARVGATRVGIVHGDASALAGWRFAVDALDDADNRAWLDHVRRRAGVDLFASTHTCLAALRRYSLPSGSLCVINNGAAGMPNFAGTQFGVISRIATQPSPHAPLYGTICGSVYVDALALYYDTARFDRDFLGCWPEDSAAHASYAMRIRSGPRYTLAQARDRGARAA